MLAPIRTGLLTLLCAAAAGTPALVEAKTAIGTLSFPQTQSLAAPTPILSFSFEVKNVTSDASGGGGGAGKAVFSPVVVTRSPDAASPSLLIGTASGVHYQRVVLVLTNAGTPVTSTLEGVTITAYSESGGVELTETLQLTFDRITISSGGTTAGWDVNASAQL